MSEISETYESDLLLFFDQAGLRKSSSTCTTGNYGDNMQQLLDLAAAEAGGPKSLVKRLLRWRNRRGQEAVIRIFKIASDDLKNALITGLNKPKKRSKKCYR